MQSNETKSVLAFNAFATQKVMLLSDKQKREQFGTITRCFFFENLPLALPSFTIVARRSRGATTVTEGASVDRGAVVRMICLTGVNADATANNEITDNNTFLIMITYNICMYIY